MFLWEIFFFDEKKEQNERIWCLSGQKLHVLYIICLLIILDAVVGVMLVCEREQTMWNNLRKSHTCSA